MSDFLGTNAGLNMETVEVPLEQTEQLPVNFIKSRLGKAFDEY